MYSRLAAQRVAMVSQPSAIAAVNAFGATSGREWQPRVQLAAQWRVHVPVRRILTYTAVASLLGIGAMIVRRYWTSRRGISSGEWVPSNMADDGSQKQQEKAVERKKKEEEVKVEGKEGKDDGCESCESCPLLGTLKDYHKHVVICSGRSSWPHTIEEEGGSFAEAFDKALRGLNTQKMKVKLTACDEPSATEGKTTVFVYPENVCYDLAVEDIEQFIETQVLNGQRCDELQPRAVPFKKLVLVCVHTERDKRCGRAGPQIIQSLNEEIAVRNISVEELAVRSSSHVGGHRFAGVAIVLPSGDNYGYITAKNAAKLLDHIQADEILKECWRGKPNPDW